MFFRVQKKTRNVLLLSSCILAISGTNAWSAVGQSAVITLVFPPGARSTGLGEAFTGLANDVSTLFYNPAGLGQDPLANSWKSFLDGKGPFLGVASKHKSDLMSNELVWAGTSKGLLRYAGKLWVSGENYLIEENDSLRNIARRFVNVDDEKVIDNAVWKIREANRIEMKHYRAICDRMRPGLKDSLLGKTNQTVESVARAIIDLSPAERTPVKLYARFISLTDTVTADKLSDEIAALLKTKDIDLKDLVELSIPFTVAIDDSVTALAMDESDRLWVGTPHGLWRCSEMKWSRTTIVDGLPSNHITAIGTGPYGDLAVGTNAGLGVYKNGKWAKYSVADGIPDSVISSVAFGQNGVVYAGTAKGLIAKNDSSITVYDTANGLLSQKVTALFFDRQNRLWIGGENGVTIFTGTAWKRFKFPGSTVTSIVEQKTSSIWMGTNKGVINYSDQNSEGVPIWKLYHSKNALKGNAVSALAAYGNDIWVATDQALNKYEWAQMEALFFYEPLLPAFHLKELWHTFFGLVYPTEDWGTLGFSINFINMGVNIYTDEMGREKGQSRSWEGVFGLSYGFALTQTLSTGLNIKYAVSALAPGIGSNGAGVGTTYAIDAAILKRDLFVRNLSAGIMFQNMGPSIYYIDPAESDPIPFTVRLGTAYTAIETPVHELSFLLDFNREIVKNNGDGKPDPFYKAIVTDLFADTSESPSLEAQQVNVNLGAEYWYSHFLALRTGFLGDYIGERYELTWGLGINYVNLNFDFSYIVSPEGFLRKQLKWINNQKDGASGARDGQWRFSFLFKL
jgi:ligand-binding sensor domain-containing protein